MRADDVAHVLCTPAPRPRYILLYPLPPPSCPGKPPGRPTARWALRARKLIPIHRSGKKALKSKDRHAHPYLSAALAREERAPPPPPLGTSRAGQASHALCCAAARVAAAGCAGPSGLDRGDRRGAPPKRSQRGVAGRGRGGARGGCRRQGRQRGRGDWSGHIDIDGRCRARPRPGAQARRDGRGEARAQGCRQGGQLVGRALLRACGDVLVTHTRYAHEIRTSRSLPTVW